MNAGRRGLTKLKLGGREGRLHRALELEPAFKGAEENLRRLSGTDPVGCADPC